MYVMEESGAANSDHATEGALSHGKVREILAGNMVMIETCVNVEALRSFLVQCRCITMEEVQEFPTDLRNKDAVIKVVGIISTRGATAFRGFIKALEMSAVAEPGLRGHKEVADTLTAAARPTTAPSRPPPGIPLPQVGRWYPPKFIWLLRLATIAVIVLSPLLVIGGIVLLSFSFQEFSGKLQCNGVGIAHSLSVFNFFFGLLCLSIPSMLVMLFVYFRCEDYNTRWEQKFRITKCLVWNTIGLFLSFFILTVFELLFSLLYLVPEVVSHFNDWDTVVNGTINCDREIYITSFSIITISYAIVFLLLVILGVYLAYFYFRWITDANHPGTLRRLILVCLYRDPRGLLAL